MTFLPKDLNNKKNISIKYSRSDYFLVLGLMLVSGNPFVFDNPFVSEKLILLLVLFFSLFIFIKKKLTVNKSFFLFSFFLIILTGIQSYIFSFFSIVTVFGLYVKILLGYLIIKILKENFAYVYIRVMYFFAIVGLMFYIIEILDHNILMQISMNLSNVDTGTDRRSVFGLYTLTHTPSIRNTGPFWEAGVNAGYLVIAFIFTFLSNIRERKKLLLIFFITIITTLSTTGFVAFFIFIAIFYFQKIKNYLFKIIILSFILMAGYASFFYFDFLGEKIIYQYEFAMERGLDSSNTQRFINVLRDIEDIKGHEFFGRGWNNLTRFDESFDKQMRTVGLTDIIVKVGSFFFIYMLYLMYRSICVYVMNSPYKSRMYCIGFLTSILVLLLSETYFNQPFFWSILFIGYMYDIKSKGVSS